MEEITTFKTIRGQLYGLRKIVATKEGAKKLLKIYGEKGIILPYTNKRLLGVRKGRYVYRTYHDFAIYTKLMR